MSAPLGDLPLASQSLLIGLSTTRFAVAVLMIPLFSPDLIPPMIRNAIMLGLGVAVIAMHPTVNVAGFSPADWIALYGKEVFIGITIGLMYSSFLWALDAAGQIIDTKIGATQAQLTDPFSGQQSPLTGQMLARLGNFVFVMSGGLLYFVNTLLASFAIWPIGTAWPRFNPLGAVVFEGEFGSLMVTTLMIAAPALLVLHAIDMGFGLLNRFAQNLNVFSLSMSVKSWGAMLILLMMIVQLADMTASDLAGRPAHALQALHRLLPGADPAPGG